MGFAGDVYVDQIPGGQFWVGNVALEHAFEAFLFETIHFQDFKKFVGVKLLYF